MENPQQQAIAANANVIAQHQEAIRTAKQATQDIIAQQKAEAQAASQAARQAVEQQRAEAQQAEESAESSELSEEATAESDQVLSVNGEEPVSPTSDAQEQNHQMEEPSQSKDPPMNRITMPSSLAQTIEQLHQDAAFIHQQMQTDILQTIQHPSQTESDAD